MSTINDWNATANSHYTTANRLRSLVNKRLDIIEMVVSDIEKSHGADSGNIHPEMVQSLYYNLSAVLDVDTLNSLGMLLERCVKIERISIGLKYNDINECARMLAQQGYRVIPVGELAAEQNKVKSGLTPGAIAGLREALGLSQPALPGAVE